MSKKTKRCIQWLWYMEAVDDVQCCVLPKYCKWIAMHGQESLTVVSYIEQCLEGNREWSDSTPLKVCPWRVLIMNYTVVVKEICQHAFHIASWLCFLWLWRPWCHSTEVTTVSLIQNDNYRLMSRLQLWCFSWIQG